MSSCAQITAEKIRAQQKSQTIQSNSSSFLEQFRINKTKKVWKKDYYVSNNWVEANSNPVENMFVFKRDFKMSSVGASLI